MLANHRLVCGLVALAVSAGVHAQCEPTWAPIEAAGVPGVWGVVTAATPWDPDGFGPQPRSLIVSGVLAAIGHESFNNIAAWDGTSWAALGVGTDASVDALVGMPDGGLVVGGSFTQAGGVSAHGVARWNGQSWSPLGSGIDGQVHALAVAPDGTLFAAGSFGSAGTIAASNIATWNGAHWSALAEGVHTGIFGSPVVRDIAVLPNGDVIATGSFGGAGSVNALCVARWSGGTWHAMGPGLQTFPWNPFTTAIGTSLSVAPDGRLAVGGMFDLAGGVVAGGVAEWDGETWSAAGTGVQMGEFVYTVHYQDNSLYAGGSFERMDGLLVRSVARWDGVSWHAVGQGIGHTANTYVLSLATGTDDSLIAGGQFSDAGGGASCALAAWDGGHWSALAEGASPDLDVVSLAASADGSIVVGGSFQVVGGFVSPGVAVWDGASSWNPIGAAFPSLHVNPYVASVKVMPSGNILAGGTLPRLGFEPSTDGVAAWNGSAWQWFGDGLHGSVSAVVPVGTTGFVAGGSFFVRGQPGIRDCAQWDGSQWLPLGAGVQGGVYALDVLPSGNLVAGGTFVVTGAPSVANIAMWNGAVWTPLGGGVDGGVYALAHASNGDLYAAGQFGSAGSVEASNIARWNGTEWNALGAGVIGGPFSGVYSIAVTTSDELLVGGSFDVAGGSPAGGVALWDGDAWHSSSRTLTFYTEPYELQAWPNVILATGPRSAIVGGSFSHAGGQLSPGLSRLEFGCVCDSIDFNGDSLFPDTQDIEDFIAVFSGAECPTGASQCGDIDFNNDELFPDTADIDSLLSVFSGGACL